MGFGLEPRSKRQISPADEEIRVAQSLWEHIVDGFKTAEGISEGSKKGPMLQQSGTDNLVIHNTADSDLDPSYQRLHLTICELANQRQKETSMRKKATSALYERKRSYYILGRSYA